MSETKNINAALLEAQREISKAIKNKDNPFTKSKYADLESVIDAVKEPLNRNNIFFLQKVTEELIGQGETAILRQYVITELIYQDGEKIEVRTPIYMKNDSNPCQAFGSGITYAKRYALQSLLGIPSADDDGETTAQKPAKGKDAVRQSLNSKEKKDAEQLDFNVFKDRLLKVKDKAALKRLGESIAAAHLPDNLRLQLRDFYEIRREELAK